MFDIGFLELTLLLMVGLLVLGPERLPRVARTIGGYVRKARDTWNSVRIEIEHELNTQDLQRQLKEPLEDVKRAVSEPARDIEELRRSTEQSFGDPDPDPAERSADERS